MWHSSNDKNDLTRFGVVPSTDNQVSLPSTQVVESRLFTNVTKNAIKLKQGVLKKGKRSLRVYVHHELSWPITRWDEITIMYKLQQNLK